MARRLEQSRGSVGRRLKTPPKYVDPFYQLPEWRKLASQVKRERGYRCERIGCGAAFPGDEWPLIADHIIEIADGGALLDRSNVQCLCRPCHARKTARAAAERLFCR
jgi:5-methylcytosine-specific restriction protein A